MTAPWAPGIEVIGGAATGVAAIELARSLQPDIVLMDLRIPGLDGVAATRELVNDGIREGDCATRVLVLTTFDDDEFVYGALCAGANGYLLQHAAPQDLIAAIGRGAASKSWIDPAAASKVIAALSEADSPRNIPGRLLSCSTLRGRPALVLTAHGLSDGEIRDRLVFSGATVKTHLRAFSEDEISGSIVCRRSGTSMRPSGT